MTTEREERVKERMAEPGFVIRDGLVIAPKWAEGLSAEDINSPEKLRAARAERNAPPDE